MHELQILAHRQERHAHGHGEIKKQCGQNGGQHDHGVGPANEGRHHEGRGSHDRRHELAARGRAGQDAASLVHGIAGFVHIRQHKGAGDRHIGHGRAGNHADERVGKHPGESRPAAQPAPENLAQLHEQAFHLEDAQQRAEHHEHEDLVRADGHEQPVQARKAHAEHGNHIVKAEGRMVERPAEQMAEEKIGHKNHGHQQQGQPPAQPRAQGRGQYQTEPGQQRRPGGDALGHFQLFDIAVHIDAAGQGRRQAKIQAHGRETAFGLDGVAHEDHQEEKGEVDGLVFPLAEVEVLRGHGMVDHHGEPSDGQNGLGQGDVFHGGTSGRTDRTNPGPPSRRPRAIRRENYRIPAS